MSKVRVLILGAAFSSDLHMDGYARCRDRVEIVGIVDKDTERINALARRYDIKGFTSYETYEEAIAKQDCDMVDVCLPNFLHYDAVMKALGKGRNVICEKPLAVSVEQAEKMVDMAKKNKKHIYYAEDWLFAPAVKRTLELIDEGGIGKTLYFRARECHSGSHSPFAQKIEYCGGGCMIHLGIHPICFVLTMKNNEWTEVTAMTSGGKENNLIFKDMEGEDWAAALIKFADGTTALLEGNYVTKGGMEDIIDIYGTEGCLHVDLTFSSAIRAFSESGLQYTVEKAEITSGWSKPAVDERYNIGYAAEIEYFLECCRENREGKIGTRGEDGLEALRVVSAIYESAKTGMSVINRRIQT